jgi:hypothetical protein
LGGGVNGWGRGKGEENKVTVLLREKEPGKTPFFDFNIRLTFLDFSSTKGNIFLNSVLTKILQMKLSCF